MINPIDPLTAFVLTVLDDDDGISAAAYEKLIDMLDKQGEDDILAFVEDNVDCGEKFDETRYFLPLKVVQNLN